MDPNKKSNEPKKLETPQSSIKRNKEKCEINENPRIWQKYLEDIKKSILSLHLHSDIEESTYCLRDLFATPSRMSEIESTSESSIKSDKERCEINENPRIWQKYLEDIKSILNLHLHSDIEESVYCLRNLFASQSRMLESESSSSLYSINAENDVILSKSDNNYEGGNIELQTIKVTPIPNEANQSSTIELPHNQNERNIDAVQMDKHIDMAEPTKNKFQFSKFRTLSAEEINPSIEVEISQKPPKELETKNKNIFKEDPLSNALVVDFRNIIVSTERPDINNNNECHNMKTSRVIMNNNTQNVALRPISDFKNNPKMSNDINISSRAEDLYSTKIPADINRFRLKIKLRNIPRTETEDDTESELKIIFTVPLFGNVLPEMDHITKNNVVGMLTNLPNSQFQNVLDVEKESKTAITGCRGGGRKETCFIKDLTQHFIEIAKDTMQSIQGSILNSFNCSSCANDLCENKRNENCKIYSGSQIDVPTLSDMHIVGKESDSKIANPSSSNNKNNVEPLKTRQSFTLTSQKLPEQRHSKLTKRMPKIARNDFPSLRKRQLELHQLKVQVEQKRLDMLNLKLAREWEEMKREKIIFEKYLLPKTIQLRASDGCSEL